MITQLARFSSTTDRHDAVVRDSLRLPSVPANQVQLVTTESVCKKANAAYQASNSSYGTGFSGKVYVVQIGTVYAVMDPAFIISAQRPIFTTLILDSRYGVLSVF